MRAFAAALAILPGASWTIYQRASGDATVTRAWINGLLQPEGAASNLSQTLARIGLRTSF
ncbi:hypothetical protein ACFFYR_33830 [Paraburkholderia dipogonis]|uniref:hypothetical protein n=1 Tax=Paraburkholderia dipogonis TaxID=1211383 RepID=UPI001AD81F59|nr:hypothetical protein [Paraburkholderia dipogonis]